MWHDAGHTGCGCGWVLVRGSLCLISCEALNKHLCIRSPTRAEEYEGRKVPGRAEETREQRRRQNRAVSGIGQATARMCRSRCQFGQRERMSQRSWWLYGNFARIEARDGSQNARKVLKTSPFVHLEQTQVRACFFFFSSILLVTYVLSCMSVKKWEISMAVDERNH